MCFNAFIEFIIFISVIPNTSHNLFCGILSNVFSFAHLIWVVLGWRRKYYRVLIFLFSIWLDLGLTCRYIHFLSYFSLVLLIFYWRNVSLQSLWNFCRRLLCVFNAWWIWEISSSFCQCWKIFAKSCYNFTISHFIDICGMLPGLLMTCCYYL